MRKPRNDGRGEKWFTFIQKNGNGVLTFTALNYDGAMEQLWDAVKDPSGWTVEDESGESKDWLGDDDWFGEEADDE